ncbi:MerR family transcriptional regulator [Diplocloster agilis]|uniref:MerR family transcriptional regulator n=1 Tax=Diplocloster agilis TaxID=2850323 RepID=A0A949K298_9FIRM|nr:MULTISPECIES: MerR family transcriptional regulator [Lachnospiraceae]MBU9738656.1 MerR family transcriptional regulator [Diplocloster agilis]MBU9744104.1 MerR family transcriptional regulator [Diplocloster agilis]MCU6735989.1 MerR family transcriptional regulator [Suonthocola fibrivorans]SCJ84955.1 Copper export regulator [uncultured Clostridium sp.]
MLIKQVSTITGLTKKAIEYYTLQGLVAPAVLNNGYRDYSQNDIELLNKISVLRKLGISTEEIKTVLADHSNSALQDISLRKELHFQRESRKKEILDELSRGLPYSDIRSKLQALENGKTITEKLLEAFPGYYGRFICMHFATFLNEPIETESQQNAFDTILDFLDNIPSLELPQDLQDYLAEGTRHIGTEQITDMLKNTRQSIENPDEFLSDNKEFLEQYLAYKKSDEYKKSPAGKLTKLMKEFYSTTGYYDVFIPALKKLSHSYSEYYRHLEIANDRLISEYPEIEHLDDLKG